MHTPSAEIHPGVDPPAAVTLRAVARVNDVGGQSGFGQIAVEPDEPTFHADWEARVYALNVAMLRRGIYNLDQFRDAIERMPPAEYLDASYYERWLVAVETLTAAAAPDLRRDDD
jgi:nitrile hydratase subunit beta